MKVLAAILSGIVAAAIGTTATCFVMTKGLGYYQETKTSIYDEGDGDGQKGKGKMMPGGKGGKGMPGGKGGKGMPGGKGGQEGGPDGVKDEAPKGN